MVEYSNVWVKGSEQLLSFCAKFEKEKKEKQRPNQLAFQLCLMDKKKRKLVRDTLFLTIG